MKSTQSKAVSRRAPRPVRVPPPLTRGDEKFEGSSVLTEFEGDFGIRIEDLVIVTDDGCELLTHYTKELVTVR